MASGSGAALACEILLLATRAGTPSETKEARGRDPVGSFTTGQWPPTGDCLRVEAAVVMSCVQVPVVLRHSIQLLEPVVEVEGS